MTSSSFIIYSLASIGSSIIALTIWAYVDGFVTWPNSMVSAYFLVEAIRNR